MRLDVALVDRGLASSRTRAQRLVTAGAVLVDGTVALRVADLVTSQHQLAVVESDPWVSRAAHKLLGALDDLAVCVPERALDAGASTGGFTQVLLSRGAHTVHAVDVGHGQLHQSLRGDPRVVQHEGLNLRDLTLDHLGGQPVDLVVADVSFISLTLLLAPLLGVLTPDGQALLMVKPQFEVGRERLGAGGVVRDRADHQRAVTGVVAAAAELDWTERARAVSQLPGPSGNVEFFVLLRRAA